jgi:tetratricopeptide (TPR) repeat protein
MDSAEILQQALQAARKGRELTARDLFLDVVRDDPNNEVAWMWLSGLLDPLEDRIAACERVLSINPGNQRMRVYYEKLLDERLGVRQAQIDKVEEQVQQVRQFMEAGKNTEALVLVQSVLRDAPDHKEAWRLFADLSASLDDKVRAYEEILRIDPADEAAKEALERDRHFQREPLELAAYYEEEGELDKALDIYEALAAEAGDTPEFEPIYKSIVRLEKAKQENVRRVSPGFTILRLSIGLPLLYLFEVFIQEGLNPIRHPAPGLWLGIPVVVLGSFLITVAGLRVRHSIWQKWFGESSSRGSALMRAVVGLAGWMLILTPHLFLLWDAYLRMQIFQTPAIPWIK